MMKNPFESESSIYDQLIAAGVPIDNHESDLYVPINAVTKAIVAAYQFKANVRTFISELDHKPFYDIPFAYKPFWERRLGRE